MQTFSVRVQGTTPLLQHRFTESSEVDKPTRRTHLVHEEPRVIATRAANILPTGEFYVTGASFARMLRDVAGGHKQKGSRKSMKYVLPAAVMVCEDAVILLDKNGQPLKTFEVDSRPVVIPATRGRVMRHRPRFDTWTAQFSIRVNEDLIEPEFVNQLLAEGGISSGIGDFRPSSGGPFGQFMVTGWELIP